MADLTGHLDKPLGEVLELATSVATTQGLSAETEGDGLSILFDAGRVRLSADGKVTILDLSAVDQERLALLEEGAEAIAAAEGWQIRWQKVEAPPVPRLTLARVGAVRQISPSFCRLRLLGDFRAFAGPSLHFRLLFGPSGAPWPELTAKGLDWPAGVDAWHRPPYTVRALDPEGSWLDVDIFLHEGGRVTNWVATLRGGEEVGLTGPGGGGAVEADWLGLVGDPTALPVILRMIEALPLTARGEASIFVPDLADAQPVPLPSDFKLEWLVPAEGSQPLDRLRGLVLPDSDRFVFFAGERQDAAAARDWLANAGLGRGEFRAAAYWTAGWVPPPAVMWSPDQKR